KTIGDYQLDSSETATLGGAYGVRAYPNGFGEADSMILTTIGLRFNIFNPNFYITPFL
ncbi:ShlB/FhaC/HecB family hemolysin secretion/activation protein, partial [Campylobacter coli]|nr:ShlB/FhaC/HecB family hemolysin secretion/activation protein [Campylobacter coli]